MSDADKRILEQIGLSMMDCAEGLDLSPAAITKGIKNQSHYLSVDRLLEMLRKWQASHDRRAGQVRDYLRRELRRQCLSLPNSEVPLELEGVLAIGRQTFWNIRSAAQVAPHAEVLKKELCQNTGGGTLVIACQIGAGPAVLDVLLQTVGVINRLSRHLAVMEMAFSSPEYMLAVDAAQVASGFVGTVNGYLPMAAGDKDDLLAFLLGQGLNLFQGRLPVFSPKSISNPVRTYWCDGFPWARFLTMLVISAKQDPEAGALREFLALQLNDGLLGRSPLGREAMEYRDFVTTLTATVNAALGQEAADWVSGIAEEIALRTL